MTPSCKILQDNTENVKLFTATTANDIYHQFKKKKINPTTKFRGPLIITPNLHIDVMIYTKTSVQTIPSLKKYSLVAEYTNDYNTCQVVNDRLYYIYDDPQQNPISKELIEKTIALACDNSVYAVENQIKKGFITASNGIRVGLGGEFVESNGIISTIKTWL